MRKPLDPDVLFLRVVSIDPEAELQGMDHPTAGAIAEVFGVHRTTIERAKRNGWDVWTAERWAIQVGLMPQQVWPEWDALCDAACGVVRT